MRPIMRLLCVTPLCAVLVAGAAKSGEPDPDQRPDGTRSAANLPLDREVTPESMRSVQRGLDWLASQQLEDGSFPGGRYGRNVAVVSLASLAFMSEGSMPGRGRYSEHVRRGLEFILEHSADSGLISAEASHGPMYGHGFATLFLGEIYGMTAGGGDTRLAERTHEALVKAVRLIEQTQNEEGGWRYNPVPFDADVSVTICLVMALRSARNAGLEVSSDVIDKAVEYVRRCQNTDGGFRYQAEMGASAWPRSAAGVASLYYAGIYEDDALERGIRYLEATARPGGMPVHRPHYHYGHYYAVQCMFLAGGDKWAGWWPAIRDELVTNQNNNGSWEDRSVGSAYGTAMSLIILQMPNRYLPIFQK